MAELYTDRYRHIFRAYDIRGVTGDTMTEPVMERLGLAYSALVPGKTVVVSRDARLSGEKLTSAFIHGLQRGGKDVICTGILPLGAGMFYAWRQKKPFVMVTASHLTKEWNGLKFFTAEGIGFMEEDLERIKDNFFSDSVKDCLKSGFGRVTEMENTEVIRRYIGFLNEKMSTDRPLKVVLDPGNGAAGVLVKALFEKGGFEVSVINEEPDGNFPNRDSDPVNTDLKDLKKEVLKGADLGIALDGDGDRIVIMDDTGTKLTTEQMSYIILNELLIEQKGPIIANVEVTRTIDRIAEQHDREVFRIMVGHNYLVKWTYDKKAAFGLEPSGHYTLPFLFPFDDSLAISFYFACVLSRRKRKLSRIAAEVPIFPTGRYRFEVADDKKFQVIEELREHLRKVHGNINTMDGVRVEFDNGWVLIRASNTGPKIRMTIEANTKDDLEQIRREYAALLEKYINK